MFSLIEVTLFRYSYLVDGVIFSRIQFPMGCEWISYFWAFDVFYHHPIASDSICWLEGYLYFHTHRYLEKKYLFCNCFHENKWLYLWNWKNCILLLRTQYLVDQPGDAPKKKYVARHFRLHLKDQNFKPHFDRINYLRPVLSIPFCILCLCLKRYMMVGLRLEQRSQERRRGEWGFILRRSSFKARVVCPAQIL